MNQVTCGLYRRDCVGVLELSESKYSNCRARTKRGGAEKRPFVGGGKPASAQLKDALNGGSKTFREGETVCAHIYKQ
ncbi:hypothetical protein WA026_017027 [Henosepilachna vigintioctopunctata]|uniref:Uncharacterized protein n=1 Tax=Henosepilachna vigintioctopunctata TaxID=420089 RepID=A0AAW1TWP5_9CUCU